MKIVQNMHARIGRLLWPVIVQISGDNRAMPTQRIRLIVCSIASALVLASSTPHLLAQPPSSSRVAADADVQGAERLFSAWLDGQMIERGLPGIAVGVVADQELVWSAGFGFADSAARIPMTPQTKFRMASHSKLFTATAVMQLREQGKLRLDDPVSKYLPWFAVKPAESDDPLITIEELLTHSSGLPAWRPLGRPRLPCY